MEVISEQDALDFKMEDDLDLSSVDIKSSLEGIIAEHQEKGGWKGKMGGDKGSGGINQTLSIKV